MPLVYTVYIDWRVFRLHFIIVYGNCIAGYTHIYIYTCIYIYTYIYLIFIPRIGYEIITQSC